jgi:hypothetical protein
VALSYKDRPKGRFQNVESLGLEKGEIKKGFFKGMETETLLAKQVFTNQDGSTDILYLAASDTTLDFDQVTIIYQKRWKVEEYHKSIKSNTGLAKSPISELSLALEIKSHTVGLIPVSFFEISLILRVWHSRVQQFHFHMC